MRHNEKIEAWNLVAKAANRAKDDLKKCIEALEELGDDIKDINFGKFKKCLERIPESCVVLEMYRLYDKLSDEEYDNTGFPNT